MILSRVKPAINPNTNETTIDDRPTTAINKNAQKFEEYLTNRDYIGAITLLEFLYHQDQEQTIQLWIAYCAFHQGNYKKSLEIYDNLLKLNETNNNDELLMNLACCYFYLGMYEESKDVLLKKTSNCPLKIRLMFHLSHKLNDENALMEYHEQLQDILEDQLSLAAIHYLRAHYQEAIDIYKRLLIQNRDNLALNVYIALCYYKLDYYDVSQEALSLYLAQYPDSVIATNLKACNHFRLYKGNSAENELRPILDQTNFSYDLVKHNLVVFNDGINAMQIFPQLVDIIPEARLNLVIYHLKNDNIKDAYDLIKNLQPAVPQEYILKGVVNAALGQELNSNDHLKIAQECFHLVGSSASECDTIDGRQCMAAYFFLLEQYQEVLIYLSSIKTFLNNDDTFNFNFAQAKTACGKYREAEEMFLLIKDEKIIKSIIYITNLIKCYIWNGKANLAWDLYKKMENILMFDNFNLLLLIANDCYKFGEFWYSAKAFDLLDRLDPNPEYWEGKRGACVGVFQYVIIGKYPIDMLTDILQLLRTSTSTQAEYIMKIIRQWIKEKRSIDN